MYSGDYHNDYALTGDEFHSYRRRKSPGVVAFWTSLLVSVATVLVLQLLILPAFQKSAERVMVPKLVGLGIAQATQVLSSLGLRLERMARQADDQPAGTILSHVPLPGRRVKLDTKVRVITSLGPSRPTPPRPAAQAAQTSNTNNNNTNNSNANTAAPSQPQPAARTSPAPAKAGKRAAVVRVPRLTNMSLARAKRALRRAGLHLRHVSFGADEDKSPHWVLEQKPRANARVPRGSAVDLTINRDDL